MAQPEHDRSRLEEAERRQRILSDVSRLLLDYVGPDEIEPLRRVVHLVTEAMGNDWCAFSLVQPDGTLKNVAAYHPDPRQRELEQKLNAMLPARRWDREPRELNALLTRQPVVTEEITDEMLRAAIPDERAFQMLKEVGLTSAIVAPMFDGQAPLGTLLLATTAPGRKYSRDDANYAYALAARAAMGVRNARLVRELSAERDRQSREREQSDRRFAELRAVFDNDPNGIALFDGEGILRLASHRIEEIFGVPLRSMYGQRFEEIYRRKLELALSQEREAMFERVRRIFADRDAPSEDQVELERPRYRALTRVTSPVRSPSGEYLGRLVVYTDVTEQQELDRQRADFLTVAAHELRTPLTPLSMYLQSIERRQARGQSIGRELVTKARRQVERLGTLVEDLLDISRLESRRMHLGSSDVELNDLADDVVADFRAQTRNHDILFHRTGAPVLVLGDRERLEQVLVNLLQNAIKYTPQGGQIRVAIERGEKEARVSVQD
ncbi:MAG: GAF domain-containing sensor histidine kinase, partial [Myxococcales bacterium]